MEMSSPLLEHVYDLNLKFNMGDWLFCLKCEKFKIHY